MSKITGIVQEITTRDTSAGTMYNLKVNNKNYGVGRYPPKCKQGDTITFGVKFNGNFANVDTKDFVVEPPGTAVSEPEKPAAKASYSPSNSKDDYWIKKDLKDDARQGIISRQAALNSALQFVSILATAGALPAPSKTKDQVAVLESIVYHYRDEFLAQATETEVPNDAPSGLPEEEEEDVNGW
jgi:hypothetical protein